MERTGFHRICAHHKSGWSSWRWLFIHRPHNYIKLIVRNKLYVQNSLKVSTNIEGKVKWSFYSPGVAQRVGIGIALLFHDRGTWRGWVVSSTPRLNFTHGKDPVPVIQKAGWAPVPAWTGVKPRPHRDSIPDSPSRNQSLYRLSYRAHVQLIWKLKLFRGVFRKVAKMYNMLLGTLLCFGQCGIFEYGTAGTWTS